MNERLQQFAASLIASTRDYVFIRREDGLLILRPNRIYHLNRTAADMLAALYRAETVDIDGMARALAAQYGQPPEQIERDLEGVLDSLAGLLQDRPELGPAVRCRPFAGRALDLPVLSEIALTYRCNNRCTFCYASAPERGPRVPEMTTAEVKHVIDKIVDQAKAPTISFTGGEPTLRPDLPELVAHAKARGMRANLITNGRRCADLAYVSRLRQAGLDSAQVSLEAAQRDVHNRVTGDPQSFDQTLQGLHNLRAAGIHTHTNTTINRQNAAHLQGLIDFLAEIGQPYLSMNMVIRTGGGHRDGTATEAEIGYGAIGPIVLSLQAYAAARGMRFVWYSPVPYCLFNPAQHGLGAQACAAAEGLLSVNPAGDVLPCSSFEQGIGNLLRQDFAAIWGTRTARYWRHKEFVPPECRGCDLAQLCCGACPLYWDAAGGCDEIRAVAAHRAGGWERLLWRARRRWIGQTRGVGAA